MPMPSSRASWVRRLALVAALGACAAVSAAGGEPDAWRDAGIEAFKAGDYKTAYIKWLPGASGGDGEQQEWMADLLLGPHGRALKHDRYEGTSYLYRAAIGGRRTAMARVAQALGKGTLGFKRVPAAAACWAKAPATPEGRYACVALTDFTVSRARPACVDLNDTNLSRRRIEDRAAAAARLCLANRTPSLLVPGPPPGAEDKRRAREYARHGIEWCITGDVLDMDVERYRAAFNETTARAIERERGQGYLDRLSQEIEARIEERRR